MRKINILCILLFVISVSAFGIYTFVEFTTSDKEGPVINIEEDELTVSVDVTEEELLKGVTATDAKDGDVTDTIVIENLSEFTEDNVRYVNYAAFDKDNHVSKASRKIIYSDYTSPRFEIKKPLRFSVGSIPQNVLDNITVEDCLDGDISDKINFTTGSLVMMDVVSDYDVTLHVSNSAGDTVEIPVTFTVYDTANENAAPHIELKKYLVYTSVGKKIDAKSYIDKITHRGVEIDSFDEVKVNDDIDYDTPGVYEIEYVMNDDEGNRGSVRMIVVVEGE